MDNKNDRKFYWEVKDFLNKPHQLNESVTKKSDTLKDSIKKMLVQGNLLYQPKQSNEQVVNELLSLSEDTVQNVVNFIGNAEVEVNKGKSDCKAFTSNITENLFSVQKKSLLTEQPVGLGGGGSFGGGGSPSRVDAARQRREEALAAANSRREAERAEKAKQRAQRERERAEDEAYQYGQEASAAAAQAEKETKEREAAGQYGPTPEGGNLATVKSAMSPLTMQKDDPNTPEDESLLPANTPANRAALRGYREEKSKQRRTENLKRDLEVLQGKDVSQLSDWEKFRIKYAQDQLSKDAEVRGRVATAMEKDAQERGAAGMYGPTPSGGNLADNLFQRAMGIDKSQLQLSPAKSSVPDTRISGTSMTYGQFKALTGRNYDAFSDIDRRTVINMAGAGKITPGNYDPNRMSESERLMMTGYQTAAGMPQTEGPRQAALYRSGEDLRQLEAQVAAAKNRTPEQRRAAGRASYQAYLQTPEGQALYKSLQSGSNQPAQQPARQQTQSVVNSFKAPAAMQNQMTQTPRTSMVPGSKSFIDAQLRKMRGI